MRLCHLFDGDVFFLLRKAEAVASEHSEGIPKRGSGFKEISIYRHILTRKFKEENELFRRMKEDVQCIFEQDPAARNIFEVILTYSGLHALWSHRIAHALYKKKLLFLARLVSQISRFFTGIEIHPGAKIGRRFFIDHGMGVVIGETCEIGNDVTIYQGVTLGGTGKESGKRHPTLHDNVLVASGAKVLGSIIIGEGSKVGAGSVVLKDVPPESTVVGIPGKVVIANGVRVKSKHDHRDMPDPVSDRCQMLENEIGYLKNRLEQLEDSKVKEGDLS